MHNDRSRSPTADDLELELQALGRSVLDLAPPASPLVKNSQVHTQIAGGVPRRILPTNNPMKTLCLLYMMGGAVITVTGRGVVFVLLGIIAIIFSVEGYYGIANYDRAAIIRFIRFLFINLVLGLVIGILALETIEQYCNTAPVGKYASCYDSTYMYTIAFIGVQVVQGLITAIMFINFYQAMITAGARDYDGVLMLMQGFDVEEDD